LTDLGAGREVLKYPKIATLDDFGWIARAQFPGITGAKREGFFR
jgi:hypothetical protein